MTMAKTKRHFNTVSRTTVPNGRRGKHNRIVTEILSDLGRLERGAALKIPLRELGETKEKVRSALNRATRKASMKVATAADGEFLYVWNAE
jgi:hypothetical protein